MEHALRRIGNRLAIPLPANCLRIPPPAKSANKHVASRLTEAERSTLFHEFLLWKERQKP